MRRALKIRRLRKKESEMRGPYGIEVNDHCRDCRLKKDGFFCQLPRKALKDFDGLKSSAIYPDSAILFMERQEPRGVFLLCEGEVKLSFSSSEGKTLILKIAKPGEVLGLMAVLSGKPYEVTAETIRPSQIAFVRREDFLRFVAEHPETSQAIFRQLSSSYDRACEQLRTVGLSASAPEKLAKLLLSWCREASETSAGPRIPVPLSHEEIAAFIGTTRETVTRALGDFRSRRLIEIHGSTMQITDRAGLQNLVVA